MGHFGISKLQSKLSDHKSFRTMYYYNLLQYIYIYIDQHYYTGNSHFTEL